MPVIDQYQIKIANSSLDELQATCLKLKLENCVLEAIYDTAFPIHNDSLIIPDDPWTKKWYSKAEEWSETNPDGANWWLEAIQAQSAWEYNDEFDSIKIGIVDNGFDTGHQDLKNIISYVSPVNNKAEHGTHVAGIIAAESNNNKGISGIVWDCDLLTWDWELNVPQKIVNGVFDIGWSTSNQILGGTVELIQRGAKVINLSVGQTGSMTGLTRTEADINSQGYSASLYLHALLVRGYDFVIVQSSGNGNSLGQSVDAIYNGLYSSINNDNCFTSEKIGAAEIIGISLYTCDASALITMPLYLQAKSIANADLPDAVGPATTTTELDLILSNSTFFCILPLQPI
jgi:subtilisin family serine protease